MPKYGNLDELLLKLKGTTFIDNDQYCDAVFDLIENFPAEPVRQEVHAAWRQMDVCEQDENVYECTACGFALQLIVGTPEDNQYNGCPRCLATMDLDAKGAEG